MQINSSIKALALIWHRMLTRTALYLSSAVFSRLTDGRAATAVLAGFASANRQFNVYMTCTS